MLTGRNDFGLSTSRVIDLEFLTVNPPKCPHPPEHGENRAGRNNMHIRKPHNTQIEEKCMGKEPHDTPESHRNHDTIETRDFEGEYHTTTTMKA
jgi:hypothetical protein